MPERLRADLLVLGAGMAGFTTAAAAARRGAQVLLLENGHRSGGSAAISGGHLWTAETFDQLREHCPAGDPELGRVLVEGFPNAVGWVRSTGVEFTEPMSVLYGRGYRFDILGYLRRCQAMIESAGGSVLLGQKTRSLVMHHGAVAGAVIAEAAQEIEVQAPNTVLATGGWQGDRARLAAQFPDTFGAILHRANPNSTGDGLRLALTAGATTAGDMGTFYGHLISWPVARWDVADFILYSLIYSEHCILLNLDGARFVDESLGDHVSTQALARQRDGRGVVLLDQERRSTVARAPITAGFEQLDRVDQATRGGNNVATAATLGELGQLVTRWGFDGDRLEPAVEAFNRLVAGVDDPGQPGRRRNRRPYGPGPYHAIEVKPGITFTEGGIRIDRHARVLDAAGAPIPGLFAAGADTGGIFNGGYAGGLALACVFGLAAVDTIFAGAPAAND